MLSTPKSGRVTPLPEADKVPSRRLLGDYKLCLIPHLCHSLSELLSPLCSPHSSHTDLPPVPQAGNTSHTPASGTLHYSSLSLEWSLSQRTTGLPPFRACVKLQLLSENFSSLLKIETAIPCTLNPPLLLYFPHSIYHHATGSTFYFVCLPPARMSKPQGRIFVPLLLSRV